MLRILLAIAGIGCLVISGMYWSGQLPAGSMEPARLTIDSILSQKNSHSIDISPKKDIQPIAGEKPIPHRKMYNWRFPSCTSVSDKTYAYVDWNSYALLTNLSIASEHLSGPNAKNGYQYAEVKGSNGQLYLILSPYEKLPANPLTVAGYFVRESPGPLPEPLAALADQDKDLFLLTYETRDYEAKQLGIASLWAGPGALLLVVAVAWQLYRSYQLRKLRSDLEAATELVPGTCVVCQTNALRVPIYFSTERRKLIAPRRVQVTSAYMHTDVCHRCYRRFEKLSLVSMIAGAIGVFVIFGVISGTMLLFVAGRGGAASLIPMALIAVSLGLAAITWLWMTWRFKALMGRELFEKFNMKWWNPLASKIEYGIPFNALNKAKDETKPESAK